MAALAVSIVMPIRISPNYNRCIVAIQLHIERKISERSMNILSFRSEEQLCGFHDKTRELCPEALRGKAHGIIPASIGRDFFRVRFEFDNGV